MSRRRSWWLAAAIFDLICWAILLWALTELAPMLARALAQVR